MPSMSSGELKENLRIVLPLSLAPLRSLCHVQMSHLIKLAAAWTFEDAI